MTSIAAHRHQAIHHQLPGLRRTRPSPPRPALRAAVPRMTVPLVFSSTSPPSGVPLRRFPQAKTTPALLTLETSFLFGLSPRLNTCQRPQARPRTLSGTAAPNFSRRRNFSEARSSHQQSNSPAQLPRGPRRPTSLETRFLRTRSFRLRSRPVASVLHRWWALRRAQRFFLARLRRGLMAGPAAPSIPRRPKTLLFQNLRTMDLPGRDQARNRWARMSLCASPKNGAQLPKGVPILLVPARTISSTARWPGRGE